MVAKEACKYWRLKSDLAKKSMFPFGEDKADNRSKMADGNFQVRFLES